MRLMGTVLTLLAFAAPAFSQDPVKVDPKHHKVEIDNAYVRVLRITLGPGETTPPHDHPAAMAVFLTDAQSRLSPVGAAVNQTPRKRGDVLAVTPTKHTAENIGKSPSEVVVVEFRNPPMKTWSPPARDAVKLDPKHYTVVAENDYARALKVRYGPNEKSVMHDHPPNVAVFLTGGKVMMGTSDGKSADIMAQRGGVQFTDAETHLPTSSPDGIEVVVIELKTGAAKPTR